MVLMLSSYRALCRHKADLPMFPDQATITEDISRSAEMIELIFIAAREEAVPEPKVLVATRA
jgi:hypothetical protein